jgi:hypothetical protein
MANTFLDALRPLLDPGAAPAPIQDQGKQFRSLLRAKQTGKAGPSEQIGVTSMAEKVAGDEARAASRLQSEQQTTQNNQIMRAAQAQETEIEQKNKNLLDSYDTGRFKLQQNNESLMRQFKRDSTRMDDQEKTNQAERMASNIRLQNQQYVTKLKQEGDRARLGTASDFKLQLAQSIMGEEIGILDQALGAKTLMEADERTFRRELMSMGVTDLLDAYKQEKATAQDRMVAEGVTTVATEGVKYGAKEGWFSSDEAPDEADTAGRFG